jgi:hypothetical protein
LHDYDELSSSIRRLWLKCLEELAGLKKICDEQEMDM